MTERLGQESLMRAKGTLDGIGREAAVGWILRKLKYQLRFLERLNVSRHESQA
jgi:hypothetical protein